MEWHFSRVSAGPQDSSETLAHRFSGGE